MAELSPKSEQLLPVRSQITYDPKIAEIDQEMVQMPDPSPDLWLKKANALASQRLLREAIEALSRGIALDPFNGILYRWRAHRYLNLSEIAEACADFTVAARLIPENWSVQYHLALSHLILGEYDKAYYAYRQCWSLPTTSARLCALTNWTYLCCRLLGRDEEANEVLKNVTATTDAGGNVAYKELVMMYKGETTCEDLRVSEAPENQEQAINAMTKGFGMAMYFKAIGDAAKHQATLDYVLECGKEHGWTCFGYSCARFLKG